MQKAVTQHLRSLFKSRTFLCHSTTPTSHDMQLNYMLTERCLCVDELDQVTGYATKADCHRLHNGKSKLHRAFSLFLFRQVAESAMNSNSTELELLLQQRAPTKLTFPNLWSNTCCSHPLQNFPDELIETDAMGVKMAAQRKIFHELGLNPDPYLPLSEIHFLTRIIYSAPNEPCHDSQWAENEVDYILVSILNPQLSKQLTHPHTIPFNPEEVSATRWTKLTELEEAMQSDPSVIDVPKSPTDHRLFRYNLTPWLRGLILTGLVRRIWRWSEMSCCRQVEPNFYAEDASWDRLKIVRLP